MKKEMLMVEDIFTWEDVINFGQANFSFNYDSIKDFCIRKSEIEIINDRINEYVYNGFIKQFPDFPFDKDFFKHRFTIKKMDNGNNGVFLEVTQFLFELLHHTSNRNITKEMLVKIIDFSQPNFKENFINELKISKNKINDELKSSNDIVVGYNPEYNLRISKDEYKEALMKKRKMIVWSIRNFDELINFFESPIDLKIFEGINKDKFLLCYIASSLYNSGILEAKATYVDEDSLSHVIDYCRLMEYLTEENNGNKYYVNFSSEQGNGNMFIFTTDSIIKLVDMFYTRYEGDIKELGFSETYEEVLSRKASKTWKRIQSERHAKNIQLNFEMIKSGKKISLSNYRRGSYAKVTSDSKTTQAKLQKAYDLLEEKMEYFSKTNPAMELVGIDTFTGYTAYMYSNGVVILEKLYKKIDSKNGKEVIVPAKDEAIYVMNYSEFIDLSKYTKPELMQEIVDFQNPNVKRIYHTPNGSWKDKVDKLINGSGYGDLDYELFDQIISNLSEKPKQLLKSEI